MTNTFATTGGTAHSTTVTGLTNGGSYSFFVRCQDAAANANTNDFTIGFSVAQPADTTPPVRSNGLPTGTLRRRHHADDAEPDDQRERHVPLRDHRRRRLRLDDQHVHARPAPPRTRPPSPA